MPNDLILTNIGAATIRATRRFSAPVPKVWRVLSEPDFVRRWMGTPVAMADCTIDLRQGGRYRFVWPAPDGGRMAVSGDYLLIAAPHRIVHTELFDEDWTDGVVTCTSTITPEGDGTIFTMDMDYTGQKGRDMAAEVGMEEGMGPAYAEVERIARGL